MGEDKQSKVGCAEKKTMEEQQEHGKCRYSVKDADKKSAILLVALTCGRHCSKTMGNEREVERAVVFFFNL